MKASLFGIELILTIVCLHLIYGLSMYTGSSVPQVVYVATTGSDMNAVAAANIGDPDSYELAKNVDGESLKSLAKAEAQRMLETGDTEKFQKELEKSGLIMRLIGG